MMWILFYQIIKRDRFTLIVRFLHLNDNSLYIKKGEPGHDPLYKLRPFIESLFSNFQRHYILSKEVSIDETMIGFKGRLSFIQYMPKKPTKWGMKAYVLADARTGYMYNWYLYTGMHYIFTCTYMYDDVCVRIHPCRAHTVVSTHCNCYMHTHKQNLYVDII